MSTPTKTKGLQKVMALWFDDADVVFQAGQKLFRVHRSILSARSAIFRDMFSMPPPAPENASSESTVEGCTLIKLPDDAFDVYNFFLAIFDASFFEPPPAVPALGDLAGILRLSHKYDVQFLRRRAVSHLNKLFPLEMGSSFRRANDPSESMLFLLEVIEPAYIANVLWIIPIAFLWVVHVKLDSTFKNEYWTKLPTFFQELYLIFREKYYRDRDSIDPWIFSLPTEGCPNPGRCSKSARLYMADYRKFVESSEKQQLTRKQLQSKFCADCASYAFLQSTATLKMRWNTFPIVLGLPNWATLAKQKEKFEESTKGA
ncbi:hypothetical protein GALMADRAFT_897108 [Galerina marginata CBS 339.88]|uniref:BTB domain-containing protein n=1 Tax=Galerina marginata (strain CBS 339.88) TaxID=685588 RepID=A0A067SQH0_GALM3|nr:hypothetical protein GALMADRAFT_897108 [Galerina marginata CBS 339.88]